MDIATRRNAENNIAKDNWNNIANDNRNNNIAEDNKDENNALENWWTYVFILFYTSLTAAEKCVWLWQAQSFSTYTNTAVHSTVHFTFHKSDNI